MSGILDQGLLDEVSCAVESGAVSRFEVEANDDSVDATGVKCDSSTRNSSEALDSADVGSRALDGGLVDEGKHTLWTMLHTVRFCKILPKEFLMF